MMNVFPMASGVGGNSSSSASNLSALAPPFTVDRLNPNFNSSLPSFNSNPPFHYPDSRYAVEPFNNAWQYARPSAPGPEVVISAGQTTVPLSDGYPFAASASISPASTDWSVCSPGTKTSGCAFAYDGGESKPYVPPYVAPLIGENNPLLLNEGSHYNVMDTSGMNLASQLDYTRSPFDLEYGTQWVGSLGFDDGKQAKRSELDGSFFSDKAYIGGSCSYNQLDQGLYSSGNKSKADSDFSYQKPSQVSEMDFCTGSSSVGHMEGKHLQQNLGFFTYDSSKTHVLKSNSMYPESHPSFLSSEMHNNISNYQSSCTPYDKCVKAVDTPFAGSSSVMRSSPAVVIRPPPAIDVDFGQSTLSRKHAHGNSVEGVAVVDFDHSNPSKQRDSGTEPSFKIKEDDTLFGGPPSAMKSSPAVVMRPPPSVNVGFGKSTLSHKHAHGNSGEGVRVVDFDHSNPSKQKDSGREPSFKIKEDDVERNFISFSKQVDDLILPSSVKDLSSTLHYMGASSHKIKARHASQPLDADSLGGSAVACDNTSAVNSTDLSADYIDTYNQGEDSPCWKGAPYPKMSTLDGEAVNSKIIEKILGEYHGFDQEEHQTLHQGVDYNKVFPEKTCQGNKNYQRECARIGVLKLERPLNTICSSNVQSLLDDAKCTVWTSTTTHSKRIGMGIDTNMGKNETGHASNLNGRFDVKACDTKHLVDEEGVGMTPNCISEGGDVAVHAAEKVLESPVSQDDDATEHPRLLDQKLNLPAMIRAMHDLSEVVLFHLSNHADSLDRENSETLKHIISNLDSCLSKNVVLASNKPEPNNPVGETSGKNGESVYMGAISGSLHANHEAVNSDFKHDSGDIQEEKGSYSFSGKSDEKVEKLLKFPPFRDDLDTARDGDMAKAIKSVLEENFHYDEEMQSQALIFKNLWLEAEAELCSISYKARFDRMKILMDEAKLKAPQVAASDLPLKSYGGTCSKSTAQDCSSSSMSGHADGIDASVVERFNILKCREENLKPVIVEEEQSELVDSEHAPSALGRFSLLKPQEGNSTLIGVEKEHEDVEMVGSEHVTSVMDRFNILKAREGNSKSVGVENERQAWTVDGDFTDKKYVMPCIVRPLENETLGMVLKPHFLYQSGCPSPGDGKFRLCTDGAGYESPNDFQLPATNCGMIHPFNSGGATNQFKCGSRDNSSSEWEHVLRDDLSWKNL